MTLILRLFSILCLSCKNTFALGFKKHSLESGKALDLQYHIENVNMPDLGNGLKTLCAAYCLNFGTCRAFKVDDSGPLCEFYAYVQEVDLPGVNLHFSYYYLAYLSKKGYLKA